MNDDLEKGTEIFKKAISECEAEGLDTKTTLEAMNWVLALFVGSIAKPEALDHVLRAMYVTLERNAKAINAEQGQ